MKDKTQISDCTILILTYKGKFHLENLLPTVREVIKSSSNYNLDVLIVDNGRDRETKSFVEDNYPEYKITWSPDNDYLFSLNGFVRSIKSDFVFILNDDIRLDTSVINQTLPIIKRDSNLFSIGCKVLDWEGSNVTISVRKLGVSFGWVRTYFAPFVDDKIRYTLYGAGGAALFRTKFFNDLGGFNKLYRPAYAEDLDLGHRAWQKGWASVINPKAIIYHREGATIKDQFKSDELEQNQLKNQFLWMLRNFRSNSFMIQFFLCLPIRVVRWRKRNRNLYIAFRKAIPLLIQALKQRVKDDKPRLKEVDIIKRLDHIYETK